MLRKTIALLPAVLVICLSGCSKKATTEPETNPDQDPDPISVAFGMTHSYDIVTPGTAVTFNLTGLTAADDSSEYQMRIDWESDGTYDADWQELAQMQHTFAAAGKYVITTEIKNTDDAVLLITDSVYVCGLQKLTTDNSGHNVNNIQWSRDGSSRIAYETTLPGLRHRIFTVDYPGGTPQQIACSADTVQRAQYMFPSWSADGAHIACLFMPGETPYHSPLRYIDLDDGSIVTAHKNILYEDICWAPDNSGIYFFGNEDPGYSGGDIYHHNLQTGTNEVIIQDPYGPLCLSPDGSTLAYSKNGDDITFFNLQTQSEVKQYPVETGGMQLAWSPDGSWITLMFTGAFDDHRVLLLLNYHNGKVYTVKSDQITRQDGPVWSEDGTMIAFSAEENPGTYLDGKIWAYILPAGF